jgi:uncharacterized membrane protein
MNEIFLANLCFAAIFLVLALFLKAVPPKKINWGYGYRTLRSMKNQDTWDTANSIMVRGLLILTVFQLCFGTCVALIFRDNRAIDWSAGFMVLGLIIMIITIELRLRTLFDEEGKRISK